MWMWRRIRMTCEMFTQAEYRSSEQVRYTVYILTTDTTEYYKRNPKTPDQAEAKRANLLKTPRKSSNQCSSVYTGA